MRGRRGVGAAVVAVLVSGALMVVPAAAGSPVRSAAAAAAVSASSTGAAASIRWGRCVSPFLRSAKARCGVVKVPLDYAHPDGPTATIAVSRVRHTVGASKYLGPILVNPGGPGGSGLELSVVGANVPNGVGARYDWIGFDPRGVGASRPRLHCDDTITAYDRPDYRATTPGLQAYWLHRSKTYAQACGRDNLALLQNITTVDTARDMDRIRAALGVRQVSYYGFSYGTYLGQVYATLYPGHVARMVLDSNVDPRKVWYTTQLSQDVAFERTVRRFFGWVARNRSTYHLGATEKSVEAGFDAEYQRLTAHPAQGRVGPDELTDFVTEAAYYQFIWPEIATGYQRLVQTGDGSGIAVGPADDNVYAVYNAVQCSDAHWPRSYRTWRADARRFDRTAPFLTWSNVWFNASCLYWPVRGGTPVVVDGASAPPVLLVDETLDPATPYSGSLEVRRLFPRSRLLALPGGVSHATSLSGDACEDDMIAAYLGTGRLPARRAGSRADATCAPLPSPKASAPVSAVQRAISGLGRSGLG